MLSSTSSTSRMGSASAPSTTRSPPVRQIKVKVPAGTASPQSQSGSSNSNNAVRRVAASTPLGRPMTPSAARQPVASAVSQSHPHPHSHQQFDAQTAKAQVNDRAVRKIMDLEIANESLLAVNTTLENTIREQALNLEQMRRLVGVLKRKVPESGDEEIVSCSSDVDGLSRDLLSDGGMSSTAGTGKSCGASFRGKKSRAFVDPFLNTLVEEIGRDDDDNNDENDETCIDHKEVEIQYNRVCATIQQLIEDGNRALAKTSTRKQRKSETIMNVENAQLVDQTIETPPQKPEQPQQQYSSITVFESNPAPTITLSSSPAKQITAKAKVTPFPDEIARLNNTDNDSIYNRPSRSPPRTSSNASSSSAETLSTVPSLQQQQQQDPETVYKKAKLLITARKTFTNAVPDTKRDLEAMDLEIEEELVSSTVEIPKGLYKALIEIVDGVHQDLVAATDERDEWTRRKRKEGVVGGEMDWNAGGGGGGIEAGGFAIGVGSGKRAVVVGGGGGKDVLKQQASSGDAKLASWNITKEVPAVASTPVKRRTIGSATSSPLASPAGSVVGERRSATPTSTARAFGKAFGSTASSPTPSLTGKSVAGSRGLGSSLRK
ncbi:hypothetical protein BDR26DRAFT_871087 [Obelidium mucronatum]|nr:hypothetical protein BDR26DRAFT_871087 [Obelidium mucronatum]